MSATKGPNGASVSDFLSDVEDSAPVPRKRAERGPFTPDAALVEKFAGAFSRTGGAHFKRQYPTDVEARKASNILLRHAEIAADGMARSVRRDILADGEKGAFTVHFTLTHKRERKAKAESPTSA